MSYTDDNTDDPNRHNIGGSMNRPPRSIDPEAPRNKGLKVHPLLNPNSKHYDDGKKTTIEVFEEEHTVRQLLNWALLNAEKYMHRQDRKGQKESDLEKIETYKNYMVVLVGLSKKGYADMVCKRAYEKENIEWSYDV